MTSKIARRLLPLTMLLLAAQAAAAAEAAYDFLACTTSRRIMVEANSDIVAMGVESWGVVASSTTPFWEKASTHCGGYIRIVNGQVVGKGVCKWTLANGDTGVGEFEYPPNGEARWTWLAGTGTMKGITGTGTFREVFSARPTDPATSQGCRRDWGRFNLP